jgi:hypothetical protein
MGSRGRGGERKRVERRDSSQGGGWRRVNKDQRTAKEENMQEWIRRIQQHRMRMGTRSRQGGGQPSWREN